MLKRGDKAGAAIFLVNFLANEFESNRRASCPHRASLGKGSAINILTALELHQRIGCHIATRPKTSTFGDRNLRCFTGTSDLGWSESWGAQFLSEGASKRKVVWPAVNLESSLGSRF